MIRYEYQFNVLSSSNRDEDFNSDFDKYEAYLVTQNEALFLQNNCNATETMKYIENKYGPFSDNEIEYYRMKLSNNQGNLINEFQNNMVFNLFYKDFGETLQ